MFLVFSKLVLADLILPTVPLPLVHLRSAQPRATRDVLDRPRFPEAVLFVHLHQHSLLLFGLWLVFLSALFFIAWIATKSSIGFQFLLAADFESRWL